MIQYDTRHGGPYDRGSADSWYWRPPKPHYYVGATGSSEMVTESEMTEEEIGAYLAGYVDNEESGGHKDYS